MPFDMDGRNFNMVCTTHRSVIVSVVCKNVNFQHFIVVTGLQKTDLNKVTLWVVQPKVQL